MFSFLRRLKRSATSSTAKYCGHPVSSATGDVKAFGRTTTTTMPRDKDGHFEFCHACLGEMAIRCWLCGGPIFIGDPITLYSPRKEGQAVPPYATTFSFKPLQFVGCGDTRCADSGADYCGYWLPAKVRQNGKWVGGVLRFESALEKAMRTRDVVVVNNLSDTKETKPDPRIIVPVLMPLTA